MKYKHNKAMGEALKDLYTHQVTLTEEVNALHNHSIYMAQRVYNELDQVNLRLTKHDGLFRSLNDSMHEIVQAVRTNQYVDLRIYQMMIALDQLTAQTLTTVVEELLQIQDYLNTYENRLHEFMGSLDNFARLSSMLVDPVSLDRYLKAMEQDVAESTPGN